MYSWLIKYQIYIAYSILALLVMGPMLLPGYVLTLDMVFAPVIPAPNELSNIYLFQLVQHVISLVLPGQVLQKVIIFTILFLSGLSAHRLIELSFRTTIGSKGKKIVRPLSTITGGVRDIKLKIQAVNPDSIPAYFAGVMYMINPFTYERWMAGQYLVLAGYALMPFLLKALLQFLSLPGRKSAIFVAVWLSVIGLFSIHTFVLGFFICAICFVVHLIGKNEVKGYKKQLASYSGLILLFTCLINSYWLIASLLGKTRIAQTIDTIGVADFQAFATASNHTTGLFFNVLSMYGFWLEDDGRFALPNTNLFLWVGLFLILIALIILGARIVLRERRLIALSLIISAVVAFIFALGVNAPLTGRITGSIIENVPFLAGFRDTQKFSAIIVLAYVYFAAYGLRYVLEKAKNMPPIRLDVVRFGALALPVLYVPTMLFGFAQQLKPVHYPDSWYSYNTQLKQYPADGKVLFLPWHQYMSYDFTPRVIANPAPLFFNNARVISGTDAEIGGITDTSKSFRTDFIADKILRASEGAHDFGSKMAEIDVEYILLSNGYDHELYNFMDKQTDLQKVNDSPGLKVYYNKAYLK